MNTSLKGQQCPDFQFCMEGPIYDEESHLFTIEVHLKGFDGIYTSGIYLDINYTNTTSIHIDEVKTSDSEFAGLKDINADFAYTTGQIEVTGILFPLNTGTVIANNDDEIIFLIYYSAPAGECADFTFGGFADMEVAFGTSHDNCPGPGCELQEVCLPDFTLGGLIESPILDCDNSSDGGIYGILVDYQESNNISDFNSSNYTDHYGVYGNQVVGGLDYTVTPFNDYYRACGLSSLDVDILHDHITGLDLVDYEWQLLSGDVDHNNTLNANDLVQILYAIMEVDNLTWPSWVFVPATEYNAMTLPTCCSGFNNVPSYDTYIEVEDIDEDITNLDFVGIKMGDANGTCTSCSNPFTEEDVFVRSAPIGINFTETSKREYALSFSKDISGLEVIMLSFKCSSEPRIQFSPWFGQETFVTNYKNGVFYIAYVNMDKQGESLLRGEPFLILNGDFQSSILAEKPAHNEMVIDNNLTSVQINKTNQTYFEITPNPNSGEFSMMIPQSDLDQKPDFSIFDLNGNLIFKQVISQIYSEFKLDLPNGIYIYSISNLSRLRSGKLVIQ